VRKWGDESEKKTMRRVRAPRTVIMEEASPEEPSFFILSEILILSRLE